MVRLVYQVVLILMNLRQLLLMLYFTVCVAALKDRFPGSVLLLLLVKHGAKGLATKYDVASVVVLALARWMRPDVLRHRTQLMIRHDLLYLL